MGPALDLSALMRDGSYGPLRSRAPPGAIRAQHRPIDSSHRRALGQPDFLLRALHQALFCQIADWSRARPSYQ